MSQPSKEERDEYLLVTQAFKFLEDPNSMSQSEIAQLAIKWKAHCKDSDENDVKSSLHSSSNSL